ncbi:hypothetical protein [Paludisphaera borealis]|uniref:Uncharacterized protein n=1 Tax=Paludisphaera borealis TaxID=1387353 RepID=A0A1U7CP62_9BACT|nr:hypothetical protein [Paludisphaera borealis]APW60699.1 hypothetical protein BSF38_02187 [Paludisphaera borealis]
MAALLLVACWIDLANESHSFAWGEQVLRLPTVAAESAVDFKIAPDKRDRTVRISIYASTRVAIIRAGGDWSRKSPFFIEFPLAFYIRIRISIILPDAQTAPGDAPKQPQAGRSSGGTPASK